MEPEVHISDQVASKLPKSVSIAIPKGDSVSSRGEVPPNQFEGDGGGSCQDDPVAWPINRCCYEELKPAELATVEHLFASRDDAPSFMKWVVHHRHGRFEKRLLVISSFRVWLLKRRQSPFTNSLVVSHECQLLHLNEIEVMRLKNVQPSDPTAISTSIKLRFNRPKRHSHETDFVELAGDHSRGQAQFELHLDPGIHSETIVRLLQRVLHTMRFAFPSQQVPGLVLPPQCRWQEFFTMREISPLPRQSRGAVASHRKELGDTMTAAYRCICDDLGVPYRSSVTARLRECLDTASTSVDFQYCICTTAASSRIAQPVIPARNYTPRGGVTGSVSFIARLVGLGTYSSSVIQGKEALALARTLEHCHCFEEVVVYDLPMADVALRSLFHALISAPTIAPIAAKGLTLNNVNLTTKALRTLQHIVLQSTIKQSYTPQTLHSAPASTALQLRRLDLSFNAFSAMMANGLSTILELLPSGLEALQLEQCHLSMHSSSRILSAMKSSHGFSSCLRDLNLSGNSLGVEGTRALALWITGAFALHRLDLSRTRLQTNLFFQSFKQNTILHESSLMTLDLSYNLMGTQASLDLGNILGKTQSLSTVVLRGMKQTLLHPKRIVTEILHGHGRRKKMQTHLSNNEKRTTNGLRKTHLKNILGPMLQNNSRAYPCMIDISENNLHGPKATALAHLIDSAPNAMLASMRLDYAQLTDKAAVLLLHSLRGCKTLESLSLDGNGVVRRRTKQSYKRFHATPSKLVHLSPCAPTGLERASADALSLLLGGKTTQDTAGEGNASDSGSAHSFTHLYHHRPKKVPLRELSLRANGRFVFGAFVLTTAIQALTVNATLRMLDVSGNECGDVLARALGQVLPQNKTLRVLYWDDNFTTVDGFFSFYEGLLRNQTLSVVQLPINDTRRILEEQKDPPREKLFSVLGKIFKVTERNQTLTQATKDHKQANSTASANEAKSPHKRKSTRQQPSSNQRSEGLDPKHDEEKVEEELSKNPEEKVTTEKATEISSATSVDVVILETSSNTRHCQESSSIGRYDTRSKYPSTMKSWSKDGPINDDVRASWDQIGSLASMLT